MKKGTERLILTAILTTIVALACSLSSVPAPNADPNWPQTAAAQTWSAMEIAAALSATATFTASPTVNTPTPTNTPFDTPTASPTHTPIPVLTQRPTDTPTVTPSFTPIPTPTIYYWGGGGGGGGGGSGGGGGGGSVPPCYAAELVRDVTIPNGSVLYPGTVFTKIWRIKNVGSCSWERGSRLVAVASNFRDEVSEIIDRRVRPGQNIEIGVTLTTPNRAGTYSGRFLLQVERRIELGDRSSDDSFNVRIVADAGGGLVYDFVSKACQANWRNGRDRNLPCPGRRGSEMGFVRQESQVRMENGNRYSVVLWTHPEMRESGEITGTFPALLIQNNDKLRIRVGCIHDFTRCRVVYDVFYQTLNGDRTRLIPAHTKTYDGSLVTLIDEPIDTPGFENNYISFSFRVTAISHANEAAAAWVVMEVYR